MRWWRRLDEEAAFKERLKNMNEVLTLVAEAITEALFNLAENVVEVSPDEGINGASDGGE